MQGAAPTLCQRSTFERRSEIIQLGYSGFFAHGLRQPCARHCPHPAHDCPKPSKNHCPFSTHEYPKTRKNEYPFQKTATKGGQKCPQNCNLPPLPSSLDTSMLIFNIQPLADALGVSGGTANCDKCPLKGRPRVEGAGVAGGLAIATCDPVLGIS